MLAKPLRSRSVFNSNDRKMNGLNKVLLLERRNYFTRENALRPYAGEAGNHSTTLLSLLQTFKDDFEKDHIKREEYPGKGR